MTWIDRIAALLLALALASATSLSAAQHRPLTTVLKTTTSDPASSGLSAAVESVVRSETRALDVVDLSTTPAMELSELQFAVGCVGESPDCLRQVAEQLQVQVLLLSSVERAGDALVIQASLFRVDAEDSQRATRRVYGPDSEARVLDEVPELLRELFGLPPAPEQTDAAAEAPASEATAAEDSASEPSDERDAQTLQAAETLYPEGEAGSGSAGIPLLPIVVAGFGVVAIGAGVTLGLASQGSEDAFQRSGMTTMADVDAALESHADATTQATLANVLLGTGAALTIVGGALFFVMRSDGSSETDQLSWMPVFHRGGAGVQVSGHFGEM